MARAGNARVVVQLEGYGRWAWGLTFFTKRDRVCIRLLHFPLQIPRSSPLLHQFSPICYSPFAAPPRSFGSFPVIVPVRHIPQHQAKHHETQLAFLAERRFGDGKSSDSGMDVMKDELVDAVAGMRLLAGD